MGKSSLHAACVRLDGTVLAQRSLISPSASAQFAFLSVCVFSSRRSLVVRGFDALLSLPLPATIDGRGIGRLQSLSVIKRWCSQRGERHEEILSRTRPCRLYLTRSCNSGSTRSHHHAASLRCG